MKLTLSLDGASLAAEVTDAGRTRGETKDCTVRATAECLNIPYTEAHALFKKFGRKNRGGFTFSTVATQKLGLEILPEFVGLKLSKCLPEMSSGRHIVRVFNHVFAITDGVIKDISFGRTNRPIRMVYKKI